MDFKIDGELLQAREAGHAIVDEAMERGVDLILHGRRTQGAAGRVPDGAPDPVRAARCAHAASGFGVTRARVGSRTVR